MAARDFFSGALGELQSQREQQQKLLQAIMEVKLKAQGPPSFSDLTSLYKTGQGATYTVYDETGKPITYNIGGTGSPEMQSLVEKMLQSRLGIQRGGPSPAGGGMPGGGMRRAPVNPAEMAMQAQNRGVASQAGLPAVFRGLGAPLPGQGGMAPQARPQGQPGVAGQPGLKGVQVVTTGGKPKVILPKGMGEKIKQDIVGAKQQLANVIQMQNLARNVPGGYAGFGSMLRGAITRGATDQNTRLYLKRLPAFAAGLYRDLTGDKRLSDMDAQQRAMPLLWHPSEDAGLKTPVFEGIKQALNSRIKLLQEGNYYTDESGNSITSIGDVIKGTALEARGFGQGDDEAEYQKYLKIVGGGQ